MKKKKQLKIVMQIDINFSNHTVMPQRRIFGGRGFADVVKIKVDYLSKTRCRLQNKCGYYYVVYSYVYYARPPWGGGIKRWCMSDVCLSRISGRSQEHRGLGRLNLAHRYSPRHTWLGHHFQGQKVKGQRSKVKGHSGREHIVAASRLQLI